MKTYYYEKNGEQIGPFTLDEIKTKRLKKSTLVWKEGLSDWVVSSKLPELKDVLLPEPPPLPKKDIKANRKNPEEQIFKSKYDIKYNKEIGATIFGIILIIINILIRFVGEIKLEDINTYREYRGIIAFVNILIRILVIIAVVNIAKRQNRKHLIWGMFAFFFPPITLIIIGLLKKLKAKDKVKNNISVEDDYDTDINILREKAERLYTKKRYIETLDVCEKILNYNDGNIFALKYSVLCYYFLYDFNNAKRIYKILIESGYTSPELDYYLSKI